MAITSQPRYADTIATVEGGGVVFTDEMNKFIDELVSTINQLISGDIGPSSSSKIVTFRGEVVTTRNGEIVTIR